MRLIFDTEPIQQMRPRIRRMPKGAMMYDPAKVKAFKILIGRIAKKQMTDNNYKRFENVPLKMNVWFFRPL